LCLFPGYITTLRSTHECDTHFRLKNDLYVPLSFVVFNMGDFAGRLASAKVPVERISHLSLKLIVAAASRVIFFPLLLLCVAGDHDRNTMAVESDFYSLLVQFAFAFTNGILVSCSFMHAPHLVAHNTGMQERSSEIMTFALSFGLLSGSLFSFPFSEFVSRL
jgi:equilibrative nucleoside transporter 1/2/3